MSGKKFKIYTASAGSGKTYTLVKEFLVLSLASDNASCKDILAVTFTNKAANEMKVKILSYLEGFICGKPDENMKNSLINVLNIDEKTLIKRSSTLYDNILHNYSDFSISTIDSFVQQISRGFAKELNLPIQYKVLIDDDDLLEGLIQCIDNQIDKDDKSITEILSDFVEFQLDEESSSSVDGSIKVFVRKLLKESAYKRGEILALKEISDDKEYLGIKEDLKKLYHKCKTKVLRDVEELREIEGRFKLQPSDYFNGQNGLTSILGKIEKDVDVKVSSLVGSRIKQVFDGQKDWFAPKGNKDAIIGVNESVDIVGLYKKLVEDHKKLFYVTVVKKNLYLYALRGTLLNIINQHIEDTNKVHLSEFNKRISDILGDCSVPFIYEKIGSKYKHFFIDEFQDTSLLQWHNFLPLVHNGLSDNNVSLLVGDAKQAIYRFRNGEVEQIMNLPEKIYGAEDNEFYSECEETFSNNSQKESLCDNWRSKKNIIEFNNSFFRLSKHKLKSEEYRNVYDGHEQNCPKEYEYDGFVSVEVFDMEKLSSKVNNDITDETGEDSTKNTDIKLNKKYKDAVKASILNDIKTLKNKGFSYRDISILVRGNGDGSDIAEFLSYEDIPVISSDSIMLKSSDKVELIIFTLKYMLDDKNDVNRLALSFYKNKCTSAEFSDVSKALNDNIDFEKINNIRNQSHSIYDLCHSIINMYIHEMNINMNIIEDEFLQYFMNQVLEWQNSENKGLDAFLEYWDKKSNSLNLKIASEIDAVKIMTIHKSKGLEFKVVLYPYAFTSVPNRFGGAEMWVDSSDFDVLKDIPNISNFILPINKSLEGTDLECYYTKEKEKSAFDDFNIMYVAMTRPADLMFIYTNQSPRPDDDKKKAESYNFFSDYFNAAEGYMDSNGENIDVDIEDLDLIENRFKKTSSKHQNSEKFELGEVEYHEDKDKEGKAKSILELDVNDIPQTKDWKNALKFEADPTMFWSEDENDYSPREWGNLVHDILSQIKTVEDADKVFNYYLNEGSIDRKKIEKLRRQFEKIVADDRIKDAYSKDAIVRNEMGIIKVGEDENDVLRPDRYVEYGDRLILIDYKTGKEYEKEHSDQLQEYIAALKGLGIEKNIDAYLVYINKVKENVEVKPVP